MYVCMCMYVCMYGYMYVCVCMYTYIHTNVCKLRPCLATQSTNSARMRTIVTAALQRQYSQTELIFRITLVHTYIHIYIHTYIHTHIHTYTHTYIHAYTHIYIHTHTHTHTYLSIMNFTVHYQAPATPQCSPPNYPISVKSLSLAFHLHRTFHLVTFLQFSSPESFMCQCK